MPRGPGEAVGRPHHGWREMRPGCPLGAVETAKLVRRGQVEVLERQVKALQDHRGHAVATDLVQILHKCEEERHTVLLLELLLLRLVIMTLLCRFLGW